MGVSRPITSLAKQASRSGVSDDKHYAPPLSCRSIQFSNMKQQANIMTKIQDKQDSISTKSRRRVKKILQVKVKGPSATASELPILWTLARGPDNGMQTKKVIQQVITKWFSLLSEEDCGARYPASH